MTEEEQRYAEAWKKLNRLVVWPSWPLWVVGLSFVMFALAFGAYELGHTSVSIAAQALGFLCFSTPWLRGLYEAWTFNCPRCGALAAFHRGEGEWEEEQERKCYRCKLPIYAPRNPDPNWRK